MNIKRTEKGASITLYPQKEHICHENTQTPELEIEIKNILGSNPQGIEEIIIDLEPFEKYHPSLIRTLMNCYSHLSKFKIKFSLINLSEKVKTGIEVIDFHKILLSRIRL